MHTGGPAFPTPLNVIDGTLMTADEIKATAAALDDRPKGITARDYFAAHAPDGFVCHGFDDRTLTYDDRKIIAAQRCYDFADAMLEERDSPNEEETP